jgi:hypothetical protein
MLEKLSADRKEFARLCEIELNKATELTGAFEKMDADGKERARTRLRQISLDMAEILPKRIPCGRVRELFGIARAHYARVPTANDLQKAWDNHMRPPPDLPTPGLLALAPPPSLSMEEQRLRKLAAVRTAKAMTARYTGCDEEPWMREALAEGPSIDEVRAMIAMSSASSVVWYRNNPQVNPYWGHYIKEYEL